MKIITKISAYIIAGSLVLFAGRVLLVSAESADTTHKDRLEQKTGDQNVHEDDTNDDQNNDGDNEDGQNSDEHDVFSFLMADHAKIPVVSLPEVDEKSIQTYADVLVVLKTYEGATTKISAAAGVDTTAPTLTASEKLLLSRLLMKHQNEFNHMADRIAEVNSQLKQLEDLLSPLGTAQISTSFGIKSLLIGELATYRDIIKDLSEFDSLNSQILEQETD